MREASFTMRKAATASTAKSHYALRKSLPKSLNSQCVMEAADCQRWCPTLARFSCYTGDLAGIT